MKYSSSFDPPPPQPFKNVKLFLTHKLTKTGGREFDTSVSLGFVMGSFPDEKIYVLFHLIGEFSGSQFPHQ